MTWVPERRHEPELLDQAERTPSEIESSLRDLRWVNRYLGGYAVVLKHLPPLMARAPANETIRILDVATGLADVPVEIARWARWHGIRVKITGVDLFSDVLAVARRFVAEWPEISLERADALHLPFADGAFHVAICSLTLHHFEPPEAQRLLREMDRVSRCGILVNDLERHWMAYLWVSIFIRLFTRNRLSIHDGPLSVLRAYVPEELAEMARPVLGSFRIFREPFYRLVLVSEKECAETEEWHQVHGGDRNERGEIGQDPRREGDA